MCSTHATHQAADVACVHVCKAKIQGHMNSTSTHIPTQTHTHISVSGDNPQCHGNGPPGGRECPYIAMTLNKTKRFVSLRTMSVPYAEAYTAAADRPCV